MLARIARIAAAIRAEIPQAEKRLLGSRARGQARPDSDADLLITVPDAWLMQNSRRMWELTGFRGSSIGFLLQQAAEKTLKAWIQAAGGVAPFTHDLGVLVDLLQELGEVTTAYEQLTGLHFFAVQWRYGDELNADLPDWPACFSLVDSLLRELQGRWSIS